MTTTNDERGDERVDIDTDVYRYDRDTTEPCSQVVVNAVAEVLDRSPLDLEPLYHFLDPEALDDLVDRSVGTESVEETTVRFEFAGCRVAVSPVAVQVFTDSEE